MTTKWLATAAISLGLALGVAAHAGATPLTIDTGWQYDQTDSFGDPSESSPLTFSLTGPGLFSLTDDYDAGDHYTVTVNAGPSYVSSFTLFSTPFDNSLGSFAATAGPDWLSDSQTHLQFLLGPGDYSLSISGDCGASCPSGFGLRLDSAGGAPEPAAWALMLSGFGLAGATLRRRRTALAAA